MKICSMNINGLKSAWESGLKEYIRTLDPDVMCLQEIRTSSNLIQYFIPGYEEYYVPSMKKGYAGVGVLTKPSPLMVVKGLGVPGSGDQGRAVTIELKDINIVNVYAPASGEDLEKLDEKMIWLNDLHGFISYLEKTKPVIICGDLNVAISKRDMPPSVVNQRTAGNTDEERAALRNILNDGYIDVWGLANMNKCGVTWAPYWIKRNKEKYGWRLDYFLASNKLLGRIKACQILEPTNMSDHRAITLEIK